MWLSSQENQQRLISTLATVRRLASQVHAMGFEAMIASMKAPKEFNRQIGGLFSRWIPTLGYPMLQETDFEGHHSGIAFFRGSDLQAKLFANTKLGCNLDKNPDFLAKVEHSYVIGEAKFLTEHGGHQDRQPEDAWRLLAEGEGDAIRVAVLDGVVWILSRSMMHRAISALEKPAMTALLLREFLESLASR